MNLSAYMTWILMRCAIVECTLSEVQHRQYESEIKIDTISEKMEITDEKINFLKNKNDEIKDRRDRVDTKARTLLTLTSILLGLISSATSIASAKYVGIWAIIPLILLFVTIFLLTVYLGVDRSQTVDYSYIFAKSESANRMLSNDMLMSQDYNGRVTDFMLDLYRAALRYFSLAILCIMILGIWNILSNDSNWFAKEVREYKTQSALKNNTFTCPKFMNESKTNNAAVSKPD